MLPSLLLIVAGALAAAEHAPAPPDEKPPARVGQIFIVGNEVIPQRVILARLPLYPGQLLTYPDLRAAERKLGRLRLLGIDSSVKVLDPGASEFNDILVTVQEPAIAHRLVRIPANIASLLRGR